MTTTDADLTVPAGRPIELPEASTIGTGKTAPADHIEAERAAQSTDTGDTDTSAAEEDEHAEDGPVDHTGEDFELDLGSSIAPVVLFALLAALAVLLGIYATAALPVQITAGLVAVGAITLAVRATARRRRTT